MHLLLTASICVICGCISPNLCFMMIIKSCRVFKVFLYVFVLFIRISRERVSIYVVESNFYASSVCKT